MEYFPFFEPTAGEYPIFLKNFRHLDKKSIIASKHGWMCESSEILLMSRMMMAMGHDENLKYEAFIVQNFQRRTA